MNYKKIYEDLIIDRHYLRLCRDIDWYQSRGTFREQGFELHHVKPKCMNGSDDSDNLVPLTPREHFIAHWLLAKANPENEKLTYAFHCMCRYNSCMQERAINSKSYEYARRMHSKMMSKKLKGSKNEKLSKRMMGKNNPMYGKHHSEESNASNRAKHLGTKLSDEARLKMSISARKSQNSGRFKKGHKMSEETKRKLYSGYICEYCGKETGRAMYNRYHGYNCWKNPNRTYEEIKASRDNKNGD